MCPYRKIFITDFKDISSGKNFVDETFWLVKFICYLKTLFYFSFTQKLLDITFSWFCFGFLPFGLVFKHAIKDSR
jgi:hypothetical protein